MALELEGFTEDPGLISQLEIEFFSSSSVPQSDLNFLLKMLEFLQVLFHQPESREGCAGLKSSYIF